MTRATQGIRRRLAGMLKIAAHLLRRHALTKRVAATLLRATPWLAKRLSSILHGPAALPPRRMHVPMTSSDLSPRVRVFYHELKQHFKTRKH